MVKKVAVTLIVVVVILVLGIGIGTVLAFIIQLTTVAMYTYYDDLLNELARSIHIMMQRQTVEIELNQDMINSLIKDNFESFGIAS